MNFLLSVLFSNHMTGIIMEAEFAIEKETSLRGNNIRRNSSLNFTLKTYY